MLINQTKTREQTMKHFAKKHLKKLMIGTLSLSLLVGLTGCGKTPEERAEKFASRISDKLELNESQEVLLDELKDKALSASKTLRADKQTMHTDFINLMSLNSIEVEQMNQFTDTNIELLHASIKSVVPSFVAFHASLDAEQKEKVVTFITKHKKERD